jgi:hypothetical protein
MARRAKKRVSTPQVKRKEIPKRSLLPESETSDERLCWRFTHVDHEGPWGFDRTKIWCLRLQGAPRLYGFLVGHVFHIVWWDPDHEIWPSRLRNT